ncbi:50S ribosomal protein L21, partial [bacterium]
HVGKPIVEGAKVEATLLEHTKGPKLIVFKKRRRKGFHKKQGHRQKYSVIRINQIITSDKS